MNSYCNCRRHGRFHRRRHRQHRRPRCHPIVVAEPTRRSPGMCPNAKSLRFYYYHVSPSSTTMSVTDCDKYEGQRQLPFSFFLHFIPSSVDLRDSGMPVSFYFA